MCQTPVTTSTSTTTSTTTAAAGGGGGGGGGGGSGPGTVPTNFEFIELHAGKRYWGGYTISSSYSSGQNIEYQ